MSVAVLSVGGVLGQELEQELEPKEAQIENLNQQLQEQDGELVEELNRARVSSLLTHLSCSQLVSNEIHTAAIWACLTSALVGIPHCAW